MLGVSRATVWRDIEELRDRMRWPIERIAGGWRLQSKPDRAIVRDELPGVYLGPRECYALLSLYNVLRAIDPGFLDDYVRPLHGVLKEIMARHRVSSAGLSWKVAVRLGTFEKGAPAVFTNVVHALMKEKRLQIDFSAADGQARVCEVSPQRIVLRPGGWYLEALDHGNGALLEVALPRIRLARVLGKGAERVPRPEGFPDSSAKPSSSAAADLSSER